jgi:hypothetical protein
MFPKSLLQVWCVTRIRQNGVERVFMEIEKGIDLTVAMALGRRLSAFS